MTRHACYHAQGSPQRCDAVGNQTLLHILRVRQPEVFLVSHVTKHRRPVPADDRSADGRRDVVIAGSAPASGLGSPGSRGNRERPIDHEFSSPSC
jgi:hypothetical protein